MHRPTREGAYKVIITDPFGDIVTEKLVLLKCSGGGVLYQYNVTDNKTTLRIGFSSHGELWLERWIDLDDFEYHRERQMIKNG